MQMEFQCNVQLLNALPPISLPDKDHVSCLSRLLGDFAACTSALHSGVQFEMLSQPIPPELASFLLEFLLPQLKSEQAITRKIISSVPAQHESYRPHPKGRSAFELARHIAVTEIWFLDGVITKRFEEDDGPYDSMRTCADVVHWYAEKVGCRMPQLERLSGNDLAAPVPWLGLRNDPAVAYLNMAIRHSVHHRGQLSAYLRAVGAKVPAIYVESADEPYPPTDPTIPQTPPPAF
jgi:uncharacterized damage-inducible protein DinB